MKKLFVVSLMAFALTSLTVARAANYLPSSNDPYYQIEKVKVSELSDEEALQYAHEDAQENDFSRLNFKDIAKATAATNRPAPTANNAEKTNGIIMIIDKLIAIGEKILPAIKNGRPVVTNNPMAAVSVLPRTNDKEFALHGMGGWTVPASKHYKLVYTNYLGLDVVSFVYSITYQYNGNLNGKGKYLTGIRVSARDITVAFGFDLNASSRLLSISNIGTQQDVIAGATVEISYTVSSILKSITNNDSFFVAGNGRLIKLD